MTLDEMKRIKHEHGLTYEMIADRSGVPLGTVQKVFTGVSKAPRYSTMKSLSNYFESLDPRTVEERYDDYLKHHYIPTGSDTSSADGKSAVSDHVQAYTAVRDEETRVRWGIPYKEQGQYTKEDYYMIPDEYRVELINGVIYQLNAPTTVHQLIVGEIFRVFSNYTHEGKGGCIPYVSPVDVELSADEDTIVQPDVMVLCKDRRNMLRKGRIFGGPDLVVEVLSPSTKKRDCTDKLHEYQQHGVREYWIIDIDKKIVLAYDFSSEVCPAIYGFRDEVPVGIYNGDLTVDFAEIDDYMEMIYKDVPDE